MKYLFFLSVALIGTLSWGQEKPVELICATEQLSTTFYIKNEGENLRVEVIHHNGVKYMPIWDGLITPEDMKIVADAAEVLPKLGPDIVFSWKTKACKATNDLMFDCIGEAEEFEVNGLKVQPWGLSVYEINHKTRYGTYFQRNVVLNMKIAEKDYRISMYYGENECARPDSINSHRNPALLREIMSTRR